jgi:predicted signal transduction protein with EAL and GGDEF domain
MAYEPNEAAAQRVTENIMTAIARPVNLKGRETFISASIGISLFPDDGDTTDLLIKDANTAMYSAKATRKNNHLFYKAEMSVEAEQRFQVANELRLALEKAQFELHYQPLISLDSNAIVGVEALTRTGTADRPQGIPCEYRHGRLRHRLFLAGRAEETAHRKPEDRSHLHTGAAGG